MPTRENLPHAPLQGQSVLITGAARRVGAATAHRLHGLGASLVLHYRASRAEAEQLVARLNDQRPASVVCLQADLDDAGALEQLVVQAIAAFGRLDALVNNASHFESSPLGDTTPGHWDRLLGSNLTAPFYLAQAAASELRARRGSIVNITDIHAERPLKGYAVYCAAKGGLLSLTRALAVELAPEVRVNAVAPGPILWPDDASFDAAARQCIIGQTLLKREGNPDDIARTVAFLLADAPYITGQVINVDGGRTAHLS